MRDRLSQMHMQQNLLPSCLIGDNPYQRFAIGGRFEKDGGGKKEHEAKQKQSKNKKYCNKVSIKSVWTDARPCWHRLTRVLPDFIFETLLHSQASLESQAASTSRFKLVNSPCQASSTMVNSPCQATSTS